MKYLINEIKWMKIKMYENERKYIFELYVRIVDSMLSEKRNTFKINKKL